jgi:type I restriction enzyme S subunit
MSQSDTWRTVPLGQAGKWLSGGTPLTTEPSYWNGEIPWISSGSLTSFKVLDSDRRVTDLGAANGTRIVDEGTILLVVRGMSLKSEFRMGITQRPVAFGQDCKALIAAKDIDPLFLAYAIKSRTADILEMVDEAGHGTGRLQTDRLFGLALGVPGFAEQRGIAVTLGAIDDKIASNRRAISLLRGLLDAMAMNLSPTLPLASLSEVAAVAHRTCKPSDLSARLVDHYSLPAFDSHRLPDRVPATEIMSHKLLVTAPSVLVSRLNPRINRTWFAVPEDGFPALASTEFMILEPRDAGELGALWLVVRHESFTSELVSRVTGTSGSHQRIRPDDALSIVVADVRQLDQSLKAEATALLEAMHQKEIEIQRLARLRDVLLPELLSGRLRVPVGRREAAGAVS